jgi:large subunit ribosomal protein L16
MALVPKFFKFKKYKKGRLKTSIHKKKNIVFGQFALKAKEPGRLTSKQIEAAKKFIKKKIKPFKGIIKTKVKLVLPITGTAVGTRMGRGKGKIDSHICPIKAGDVLFEIYCLDVQKTLAASLGAIHKLPIDVKIESKSF